MNTSFFQNKANLAFAEMLRPGRESKSLLVVLSGNTVPGHAWSGLKTYFSSASGTAEEALEQGVRRVNEEIGEGKDFAWGGVVALAADRDTFAVASGGDAVCYLLLSEKQVDVSPAATPGTRAKIFAALSSGEYIQGAFVISLRQHAADELIQFAAASLDKRVSWIGDESAYIAPVAAKTLREHGMALCRRLGAVLSALTKRETYLHVAARARVYGQDPHLLLDVFTQSRWRHATIRFTQLSSRKKAIIIGAVCAVTLLVHTSLSALGARTVEEIIAETLIREGKVADLIREKKEEQALALLDETIMLLGQAPARLTDTQQESLHTLQDRLVRTAADLNKVSLILSPTPVVSMEKSFREARTFDLTGLAMAQGRLYTVNRAEKEIYELDGRERRIIVIQDFPAGAGSPVGIITSVPGIVHIRAENPPGVLALDTRTREFAHAPLTLPRQDALPVAFANFNERLYMLDARSRAIYRYELTPQGFNLWTPWTDDASLDFSQATTFAIDGSIYLTFSDHDIVKLTHGTREPFAVGSIRPPLEMVTAIATKENSPFLYLLDPPQRRVVVIMKETGALVAQYTSPVFTDLRGLFPDETAKRIYLLNGDTIYSVGPEDESIIDQLGKN